MSVCFEDRDDSIYPGRQFKKRPNCEWRNPWWQECRSICSCVFFFFFFWRAEVGEGLLAKGENVSNDGQRVYSMQRKEHVLSLPFKGLSVFVELFCSEAYKDL